MSNLTVDAALRSVDPKKLEVYLNKHPDLSFLLCTLVNSLVESDASNMHEHLIQQLQCLKEQHTEQVSSPTCYTPVSRFEKSPSSKKLSIVIFGASGDLARKKTLPALHSLFYGGLLPEDVLITGYNRSVIDLPSFLKKVSFKSMKHECMQLFQERLDFVSGSYHKDEDFVRLNERLREREGGPANRIFYLALPPTVFLDAAKGIHKFCTAENDAWTRVIIEKPFGFDLNSSNALSTSIGALFREEQTFRIDHYLGKEMVQNLVALRFSNKVFSCIWDAKNIANVSITFKEPFGTEGRGGYFDTFGIIRDVIQNHLLQIVALIAMEPPQNLDAESIRNEKVAVLKLVEELNLDHVVLGQYAANPETGKPGYLDDDTVPKNSTTPTFTTCVLNIRNDRWKNVPFILKAGKALDDRSVVVRIQFHEQIQPFGLGSGSRNELVIRCQPEECVYFKFNSKVPGEMGQKLMMTDLDLTYNRRFSNVQIPEAYESLIYEAICGSSTNFVRADELEVAWKIFTPLLQRIESEKIKPIPYVYGSRGPKESDELIAKVGYVRSQFYKYSK